jgi:uncharacterized membrane protein YphA (DoxX/SURF4 family)
MRTTHDLMRLARDVFSLDYRSLALLRVATAGLLLLDLFLRVLDLPAFYTDTGVLPRSVLLELEWNSTDVSLHLMSGLGLWQGFLFLLTAFFALLLLLGYQTRLAAVACCVLLLSLWYRNPMVVSAQDDLLYLMLFWGIFLPWGRRYSLDAVRQGNEPQEQRVMTFGTVGFMVQIACMWHFSAHMKLAAGGSWFPDGNAIQYAVMMDDVATMFSPLFRPMIEVNHFLTYAVFFWELLGPFLLFIPFWNGTVRLFAVAGFWAVNLGIGSLMYLGLFPWLNVAALFAFLPPIAWELLGKLLRPSWKDGITRVSVRLRQLGERLEVIWPTRRRPATKWRARRTWLVEQGLPAFLCVYVFFWNLSEIPRFQAVFPSSMEWIGRSLGIDQHWGMFGRPAVNDGWFVIVGRFESGKELDMLLGSEVSWTKPERVRSLYRSFRWRRYFEDIWNLCGSQGDQCDDPSYLPALSNYFCHKWNHSGHGEDELLEIHMTMMVEHTTRDFRELPPRKKHLFDAACP